MNEPIHPKIEKEHIRVIVRNRKGVLLDDQVKAISAINERGIFDVLPLHANFISIIKDSVTVHKKTGKEEMKISQGVMKVYENEIHIFLDITESTIN